MEVRPIDANALVAKLDDWRGDIEDVDKNDAHDVAYYSAMSRSLRFAKDAPTLDYAPVVHGEFERQPEEYIVGLHVTPIYCKTCDTTYFTMNKAGRRTICCPYCGAKMGEKNERE